MLVANIKKRKATKTSEKTRIRILPRLLTRFVIASWFINFTTMEFKAMSTDG